MGEKLRWSAGSSCRATSSLWVRGCLQQCNLRYRSHYGSVAEPRELTALRGKCIVDIVAGGWFSCARSSWPSVDVGHGECVGLTPLPLIPIFVISIDAQSRNSMTQMTYVNPGYSRWTNPRSEFAVVGACKVSVVWSIARYCAGSRRTRLALE